MDSRTKKVLWKFWLLTIFGVTMLIAFLLYGTVFDLWGKQFRDMSRPLYYGLLGFFVFFIFYPVFYLRFVGKHDDVLSAHKTKFKTRIMGVFLIAGIALFSKDVRPINIQVVEALTKQPVKNAVVYYELETVRIMNFLGIPILDPLDYRYVIKSKYYTDESGYVKIPKQKVYLRLYEDLLLEYNT